MQMYTNTPTQRRRGRPPKHQQGINETRDTLLRSGVEILTEKGFSAAGLDEILKRVNVPKGSFYHYFNSKEAYGAALIQHYDNFFAHKLDTFLQDTQLKPLDRIKGFVQDATNGMERFGFRRGCLVGNLGQEMGALPEPYRELLKSIFERWQQKTETCLKEAQQAGDISKNLDCKSLALVFWIGWEGAVLRAKLEQNQNPLQQFSNFFFNSLNC